MVPTRRISSAIILAAVGIVGSLTLVGVAFTNRTPTDNLTHSTHFMQSENPSSIQLASVEHAPTIIREGDAKVLSRFTINSETLEPDSSCEFCTQVIYKPGKEGTAAAAYQLNKTDLRLSKRIVFFAMGEKGGEQVSFIAAGKRTGNGAVVVDRLDRDLFPDVYFEVMTKNITLPNHWKRYEISLLSNDLVNITHPFGYVVFADRSAKNQSFFLKGITFDDNYATNPVSMLSDST